MKVLVTGGAGYVGIMVTAHLLQKGFKVQVFDKCLFGAQSSIVFPDSSFRLIHGDVRDSDALFAAIRGVDAVVHLAAIVGESACLVDPNAAHSINLEGTELALQIAQKCDVERFIFISTCSNYGISSQDILTTEESPLNPLTEYAIAKVLAEKIILANKTPLITTVFRFGTICGLSPQMRFDLLVNDLARASTLDQPIKIFAPDAWRPFLHIKDAARAIEYCLISSPERVNNQVFNVVSENYQKRGLADLVRKHFPKALLEVIDKSSDSRDYRVSSEKIRRELNYLPKFTIEDAFLDISQAIRNKVFLDPLWRGFSAVPASANILKMNKIGSI